MRSILFVVALSACTSASGPASVAEQWAKSDGGELAVVHERTGLRGHFVRMQQSVGGIPVVDGQVVLLIDPLTQQVEQAWDYRFDLRAADVPTARIDAGTAQRVAAQEAPGVPVAEDVTTLLIRVMDGVPRLIYRVEHPTDQGSWLVDVDAVTGALVERVDQRRFASGTGYVFDPNPIDSTGTTTLSDSNDANQAALTAARYSVTLDRLDGSGYLRGDWVDARPTNSANRASSGSLAFNYDRNDDHFEEVSAYYHLDRTQERYQALGFNNVLASRVTVYVNAFSQDNSYYDPANGSISTGYGGVDDAEDAEVIVHEYGHAVQDDQVPNWGTSYDALAMGEGFGDYNAGTISAGLSHQVTDEACLMPWDASSFNMDCLRRLDGTAHWPEAAVGESHTDGEMWSAALWDARTRLDADTVDTAVIEHHFALNSNAEMIEAGSELVSATDSLFGSGTADTVRRALIQHGVSRDLTASPNYTVVTSTVNVSIANPTSGGKYSNNVDNTQTYTVSGAAGLRVHFDSFQTETDNSCIDSHCDNVYLTNGDGDLFQILGGNLGANTSVVLEGDTVNIRLVSDPSVTYSGYHIDRIDVMCGSGTVNAYVDADGDGYGAGNVTQVCAITTGYAAVSGDCNDGNAAIKPGATEVAGDSVDQNCDSAEVCYTDADNDGYRPNGTGTVSSADSDCGDANEATSADPTTDCNDSNAAIKPGAAEIVGDSTDQDCDNVEICYTDADDDGYRPNGTGTVSSADRDCGDAREATSADPTTDCNDGSAAINPGATEAVGDSVDSNCNGGEICYLDSDDDGYRPNSTATVSSADSDCGDATEAVSIDAATDCNDASGSVHPGAIELCNSIDDDCDSVVDDGAQASSWYSDADRDGYGTGTATVACTQPSGSVAANGDCDDGDAAVNPGAIEQCDSIDNDCDGAVDDGVQNTSWYEDADGDGYGAGAARVTCSAPNGWVSQSGDCDDSDAAVNPLAVEVCNTVDDDCDGAVDDGAVGGTWYTDVDGDGFGTGSGVVSCVEPADSADQDGDCDDAAASVNPAAIEICDGRDQDCDGAIDDGVTVYTWHPDADLDTYGDSSQSVLACAAPQGTVADARDCADTDATINPSASEICDGIDQDCDGIADDGVIQTWYTDADADGYGDPDHAVSSCVQPSGTAGNGADCDDSDATVNPLGTEIPADGIDQDCDGIDGAGDTDPPIDTGADTGADTDDTDAVVDTDTGAGPDTDETDRPIDTETGDTDETDRPIDTETGDTDTGDVVETDAIDTDITVKGCGCNGGGSGAAAALLGLIGMISARRKR